MGNQISQRVPSATTAGISTYVGEAQVKIEYERSLGSGRCFKTFRGNYEGTSVVVKIFVKPPDAALDLQKYISELQNITQKLQLVPNTFPVQRIMETERACLMIRQHLLNNLYDRISTRPFLNHIEKKWITFQLLSAVAESHALNIFHGDIKTENLLVTSWNSIYITDFAPFKPAFLPEDNPTDFSFFFDTSGRRTCYIAPERFYNPNDEAKIKDATLTQAMDIFSVGCVIAELFLEGKPLFTLADLLKFRSGEFDPSNVLSKIEDPEIRELIKHMIQRDPAERLSAEEYLSKWKGKAFPLYFYQFLHQYVASLTDPRNRAMTPDKKIEAIYHDYDKIAFFLGFADALSQQPTADSQKSTSLYALHDKCSLGVIARANSINTEEVRRSIDRASSFQKADEGALIFVSLICSLLRNVRLPSSRIRALDMLYAMGTLLPDAYKLDRIIPFVVTVLSDPVPLVRCTALTVLTNLLTLVNTISPGDADIFVEYIRPYLSSFAESEELLVRITYAKCLPHLAETSLRFLELSQKFNNEPDVADVDVEGDIKRYQTTYDNAKRDLQDIVQKEVTALLLDRESVVKRTLLSEITRLCIFFGYDKAYDIVVSHMITFLNSTDWQLRCAFFESTLSVGTFVGGKRTEEYILPLIYQALTDGEEFVVEKAINSLTGFTELKLFQTGKLMELVDFISPFLCYPGMWIRYSSIAFIAAVAKRLSLTDLHCVLFPKIKSFLRKDILTIDELTLLESLKSPISRAVYNQTLVWANKLDFSMTKTERNLFLKKDDKPARKSILPSNASNTKQKQGLEANENGEKLQRLSALGVSEEDEIKLAALFNYISLANKHRQRNNVADAQTSKVSESTRISLMERGVAARIAQLFPLFYVNDNTHQIENQDKRLKKFFDKKALEAFPLPLPDLGVASPANIRAIRMKRGTNKAANASSNWKLQGRLIAHFVEHKGAISDIKVSPDHSFFASASDDGTVKIWDTHRLEKYVTNRSRLTYEHNSRVTCLTFLENSHTIASAAMNGSIHIFRVEFEGFKDGSNYPKYGKTIPLHKITLDQEYAIAIEHYNTASQSMLVYATSANNIYGWDLRTKKVCWTLKNPPQYGYLTSFLVDHERKWVVAGTSRGVFVLWDIRFHITVKAWMHFAKMPIHRILPFSNRGPTWVLAAVGEDEFSSWDVETSKCKDVFSIRPSISISRNYSPLDPPGMNDFVTYDLHNGNGVAPERSVRGLAIPAGGKSVFSVGTDRRLRYWDLENIKNSTIVSGPLAEDAKCEYTQQHLVDITLFSEFVISRTEDAATSAAASRTSHPAARGNRKIVAGTPPAGNVSCIQSVALSELPFPVAITGSRDGIIKVWK